MKKIAKLFFFQLDMLNLPPLPIKTVSQVLTHITPISTHILFLIAGDVRHKMHTYSHILSLIYILLTAI